MKLVLAIMCGAVAGVMLVCAICGTEEKPPEAARIAFGVLAGILAVFAGLLVKEMS